MAQLMLCLDNQRETIASPIRFLKSEEKADRRTDAPGVNLLCPLVGLRSLRSPPAMKLLQIEHYVGRLLPNWYRINALLIAPHFYRGFARLQRHPTNPLADYHDFLVDRMARNQWSELHLRCVDKETAKEEAKRLVPAVCIPRTQEVIQTPRGISKIFLQDSIGRYVGQHYVAKPTQGSGAVLFLNNFTDADLTMLFRATRYNQFYSFRETQYHDLPSKIIVEDNLARTGEDLLDYKFFCSHGSILFVQVDFSRFSDHRRLLLAPTSNAPMSIKLGAFEPPREWKLSETFGALCGVARALSAPFDFVRVDLYDVGGKPYFSEFTFTPGAGLEPFSDANFAKHLFRKINNSVEHFNNRSKGAETQDA